MTKFTKKILAAASAGTMFLSLASPVLADNTIEIIGNGYDSENEVEVELENETSGFTECMFMTTGRRACIGKFIKTALNITGGLRKGNAWKWPVFLVPILCNFSRRRVLYLMEWMNFHSPVFCAVNL